MIGEGHAEHLTSFLHIIWVEIRAGIPSFVAISGQVGLADYLPLYVKPQMRPFNLKTRLFHGHLAADAIGGKSSIRAFDVSLGSRPSNVALSSLNWHHP